MAAETASTPPLSRLRLLSKLWYYQTRTSEELEELPYIWVRSVELVREAAVEVAGYCKASPYLVLSTWPGAYCCRVSVKLRPLLLKVQKEIIAGYLG